MYIQELIFQLKKNGKSIGQLVKNSNITTGIAVIGLECFCEHFVNHFKLTNLYTCARIIEISYKFLTSAALKIYILNNKSNR